MQTWLHTLGIGLAATLIAGCGLRTAVSAEADVDEAKPAAMDGGSAQPCGFGPPCNAKDLGGRTCESLALGPGDLSCDPKSCLLVLKGCGPSPVMKAAGTGGLGDTTGVFGGIGGQGGMPTNMFGDAGMFPPNFGGTGTTDEDAGTMPFPGGFFGGLFGFFGGGNDGSGGSGNNGSRGSN